MEVGGKRQCGAPAAKRLVAVRVSLGLSLAVGTALWLQEHHAKPRGQQLPWELMKQHVVWGGRILKDRSL